MANLQTTIFLPALVLLLQIGMTSCECELSIIYACIENYATAGTNDNIACSADDFNLCLTAGGLDSCTDVSGYPIEDVRNYLQSDQCTNGSILALDSRCIDMALECKTQTTESLQEKLGFEDTPTQSHFICACENFDDLVEAALDEFETCIENSDFSACSQDQLDNVDRLKEDFEGTLRNDSFCMEYAASGTTCECASKIDICIKNHLGNDFRKKQEDNPAAYGYPECLALGTEDQFKSAGNCVRSLTEDCGIREFSLNITEGSTPPYGFDIVGLSFSCKKECENQIRIYASILPCAASLGSYASLTDDQIKALEGQNKTDYCTKVGEALKCAADKLSVCPILLFSLQQEVESYKAGESESSLGDQGLSISLEMFVTCDINVLDYTNIFKATNGAVPIRNPGHFLGSLTLFVLVVIACFNFSYINYHLYI